MSLCDRDLAGRPAVPAPCRPACPRASDRLPPAIAARPKSVMRTSPLPSIITLAGLRSRCSTPRSCAAASPAQSWRAMLERLVLWQPADAPQQRRQILAVHVLHREERVAVGFADVVDAADVRVRDLAREANLVVELREARRIALERVAAGTSARPAARASGRRRDRPRPSRPGRGVDDAIAARRG